MRYCLIALLLLLNYGRAKAGYQLTDNCKKAYSLIWKYDPDGAALLLAQEKKTNPANAIPLYLEDLGDFLNLFATEDGEAYKKYRDGKEARIKQIEKAGANSPWSYFCRAEVYLHQAAIRIKFGEYLNGAYDINSAYHLLDACNTKYPDFLPAKKDLLLLRAAVGTVPEKYHWMLRTLGFKGELKPSMAAYGTLISDMEKSQEYDMYTYESRMLYSFLTYYLLNDVNKAWAAMDMATKGDIKTNPLSAFCRGTMALRLKKNEDALQALQYHTAAPPAIPHLDYMMGIARLQKGQTDAAFYLGRYLRNYKGHNYIKDAYLKLGWAFLLNNDKGNYDLSMKLLKHYGSSQLEEDRNAQREASRPGYPVIPLLKARLYYDGGYYKTALQDLEKTSPASFATDHEKCEYHYRYGRIAEALEDHPLALKQYGAVLEMYSKTEGYYAPAAAFYTGLIYEEEGMNAQAISYYRKCQAFKDYIYKDSFDQKANAGLRRLGQ